MEWQLISVWYGIFALLVISQLWLWTTEIDSPEWQTLLRSFVVMLFLSPMLLLLPNQTVLLPILVVLILWLIGDISQMLLLESSLWFALAVGWSVWFAVLFTLKNPYLRG